jgi:soluble lytic murein transglycosylase-like protein
MFCITNSIEFQAVTGLYLTFIKVFLNITMFINGIIVPYQLYQLFKAVMSWPLKLLLTLLASCLLAAPAAAGIKRFTDSQGVIRISNVEDNGPRRLQTATPAAPPLAAGAQSAARPLAAEKSSDTALPQPSSPAVSPESRMAEVQPLPEHRDPLVTSPTVSAPAPPAALPAGGDATAAGAAAPAPETAAARTDSGEQASSLTASPDSLLYIAPLTRPAAGVDPVPGNPETAASSGQLPVQNAAFEPEAPRSVSHPVIQAPSPPRQEKSSGGIRTYRNREGVLVITNVAPTPAETAPRLQHAENGAGSGKSLANKSLDRDQKPHVAADLRPVSWNPEQMANAPLPARGGTAAAYGSIRRYRDRHGVIRIDNDGPGSGESQLPPGALALAGPALNGPPEQFATRPPPSENPAHPPPADQAGLPGVFLKSAASLDAELGGAGGVQRLRDRLGFWHIKTVNDRWVMEAPVFLRPAADTREVLLAAVSTAARAPEFTNLLQIEVPRLPQAEVPRLPQVADLAELTWAALAALPVEPAPPRYRGISANRDSQGRLVITNAPVQAGMGSGSSWTLAGAHLEPIIREAAQVYQLPPSLIRAVIKVESNFVHLAVSPKGAMGLMQLMPGTARLLGVEEPFNPRDNIHGGCRYLRMLIDEFGGSLPLALAAYNAGPQRVVDSGFRVPEIKETQEFLTQVIGRYLAEEKKNRSPWT